MTGELIRQGRRAVRLLDARDDGRGFVASFRRDVSGNGSMNLHLRNPEGSGKTLDVVLIHVASQFRASYTVFDELNGSVTEETSLTPDNLRMDSASEDPDPSVADVNTDVTFDDTTTPHLRDVIGSGGAGGASGGVSEGTEPIMEPGREIVIRLSNESGNVYKGAIGVVYIER